MPRQPVIFGFPIGYGLYAVDFHADGRVVDQADGSLVAKVNANWNGYSYALADANGVGIYTGTSAHELDFAPVTGIFQRQLVGEILQDPTFGDKRVGIVPPEGVNVGAIAGSVLAAANLSAAAKTEIQGEVVAGDLTVTRARTNLTSVITGAFVGRSVYFLDGDLQDCAALITGYDGVTKDITFSKMPAVPTIGMKFVIV